MKKIYSVCFLFALLAFVSCSPEEEDLFEESAAERIDAAIKEDLAVLQGAKNGWVMEYYPSETKMFGGYTILVNFNDDGTVDVACDLFEYDKVVSSEYEVKQSTGPVLTFDTYNEIFHFFSEPSNFLGIGETGKGMEGDYEFLILDCTPEQVVLKGKKTGTKMVMTPLPENEQWTQYLTNVKGIAKGAYPSLYDVKVGGETQYAVKQEYHLFILENKDGSQEKLPFVYTDEGIKFYEPMTIGGHQVQFLNWNEEAMAYSDENITIQAQELPAGYKKYDEFLGSYQFVYNSRKVVTLREELFNSSFIMEGFPMDIRVIYKADTGVISIESQLLQGSVYLCPWALNQGGSLTNRSGAGLIGVNAPNGIVLFEDNGVWGSRVTDSFIAYDLASGASVFQIPFIQGMIKL